MGGNRPLANADRLVLCCVPFLLAAGTLAAPSTDPSSDPAPVDPLPAGAPAPAEVGAAKPDSTAAQPAGDSKEVIASAVPPATRYEPLLSLPLSGFVLSAPAWVASRAEAVSGFPVDQHGTIMAPLGVQLQARIGVALDSRRVLEPLAVLAEAEADARASPFSPAIAGVGLPYGEPAAFELRKTYLRASFANYAHVTVGATTSHWGMGLIANDGAHGWEPGSARFADPMGGDRVLRASVATGPYPQAGGLFALIGADRVIGDDVTVLDGDVAYQALAAAVAGYGSPTSAGVYLVRRHQEAADGGTLDVWVGDVTGRTAMTLLDGGASLSLEGEFAAIVGDTTLAPSVSFLRQGVFQLGGAARVSLMVGSAGGVVDFLYASGDQNPDDDSQNAFRPDPNYQVGFLLYRHLVAGLTGRIPVTAGNPELVGHPAIGLDRAPSRGSATNTVAFFPRALWTPSDDLEVFGGPLVAFAPAKPLDPLNTRFAGGSVRNALNGSPGFYLGTELDAGLRYRVFVSTAELLLGVEGGALVPGDAYVTQDGSILPLLYGGRVTMTGRL